MPRRTCQKEGKGALSEEGQQQCDRAENGVEGQGRCGAAGEGGL